MMTLMQQMQRDQNDYTRRHDQSMLEFTAGMTEDMRALTLRVDDLHNFISQRNGGESSRSGEQARRRARTRGRFRRQEEEEWLSSSHFPFPSSVNTLRTMYDSSMGEEVFPFPSNFYFLCNFPSVISNSIQFLLSSYLLKHLCCFSDSPIFLSPINFFYRVLCITWLTWQVHRLQDL